MTNEPKPILLQVAQALEEKGIDASYEYPGFVAVSVNGKVANFGNVNVDFGADWDNGQATGFFMPDTASVDELITAITGWISQQILTPVAKEIMDNVMTAMEHAEGMYGPDDYATLMESIAYEANQRMANYRAWNADERLTGRAHKRVFTLVPGQVVEYQDVLWTVLWSDGLKVGIQCVSGTEAVKVSISAVKVRDGQ